MNIKLVALDMDGTLLNSKKEKPAEFIPWVEKHPEIKVVIASGRQYYTLEKYVFILLSVLSDTASLQISYHEPP